MNNGSLSSRFYEIGFSQCFLMKGRIRSLAGELNWKKLLAPSASRQEKNRLSTSGPVKRNWGLLWGDACRAAPGWHTGVDGCLVIVVLTWKFPCIDNQLITPTVLSWWPLPLDKTPTAVSSFVASKGPFLFSLIKCVGTTWQPALWRHLILRQTRKSSGKFSSFSSLLDGDTLFWAAANSTFHHQLIFHLIHRSICQLVCKTTKNWNFCSMNYLKWSMWGNSFLSTSRLSTDVVTTHLNGIVWFKKVFNN